MTESARDWQDLDEFLFRGAWNPELRRFRSRQAFTAWLARYYRER